MFLDGCGIAFEALGIHIFCHSLPFILARFVLAKFIIFLDEPSRCTLRMEHRWQSNNEREGEKKILGTWIAHAMIKILA